MTSQYLGSLVEKSSEPLSQGDLDKFYCLLDKEIENFIAGNIGLLKEEFRKIVRLRTLTPILALNLFKEGSLDLLEARKAALKAALISEGMSDLASRLGAETSELMIAFYQKMRNTAEARTGGVSEEKFLKISVLDVGAKQRTITRTGELKEMRGASLLIDSLPRIVADVVKGNLGQEFVLTEEAGELAFLSVPDLEEKLRESIQHAIEEIPFSDTLQIKVNFGSGPLLSIDDLLTRMGSSYVLSLASSREIHGNDENRSDFQPSNLCLSCRNNEVSLSDLDKTIKSVFSSPSTIINLIARDFPNGRVCKKCLSQWIYGHCLVQLLNGNDQGWSQKIAEVVKRSNVFKLLNDLKEHAKGLKPVFITSLDEYNYKDYNALIAMVAADGDKFGRLKTKSRSIVDFYALSNLFTLIMREGFISGARESLRMEQFIQGCLEEAGLSVSDAKIPITPIFIAGDDMLFIIRAEHLIEFMKGFHREAYRIAERAFQLGVVNDTIGVSMGAAVARTKVPGLFLYNSSHEVQGGLKRVVRNSKIQGRFATHLHLSYLKSSASWSLVKKVAELIREEVSSHASTNAADDLRKWLIWMVDRESSPVMKAILKAWEGESAAGRVRGDDLKEVLEELVTDRVSPELALLRWMSDISRAIDSEDQEKRDRAERMREIVKLLFGSGIKRRKNAWLPLYLLSSVLDMLEDRVEREAGGKDKVDYIMSCLLEG